MTAATQKFTAPGLAYVGGILAQLRMVHGGMGWLFILQLDTTYQAPGCARRSGMWAESLTALARRSCGSRDLG